MNRTHFFLATLAAWILLPAAVQAQAVTYDFTGAVTFVSGVYGAIPLGSTVDGTYTFNLANASPTQSMGVVGSPSQAWTSELFGGSFYLSAPTPVSSVVFSSTAQVDGFTYASAPPSTYLTSSEVLTFGPPTSSDYDADELICPSSASCNSSSLHGNDMFGINYTSAGLPEFAASPSGWSGEFATGPQDGSTDYLEFSISSLTPVTAAPEPTTLSLLGFGAASLCFVGRRKRKSI